MFFLVYSRFGFCSCFALPVWINNLLTFYRFLFKLTEQLMNIKNIIELNRTSGNLSRSKKNARLPIMITIKRVPSRIFQSIIDSSISCFRIRFSYARKKRPLMHTRKIADPIRLNMNPQTAIGTNSIDTMGLAFPSNHLMTVPSRYVPIIKAGAIQKALFLTRAGNCDVTALRPCDETD